jgi:uncharacterized protein (DUF342 family)
MTGCNKVARGKQCRCGEHQTLNPNGDSNSHNETDNNTNNPIKVKKQIRRICSINEFQTIA